jgi:hypothetical protein
MPAKDLAAPRFGFVRFTVRGPTPQSGEYCISRPVKPNSPAFWDSLANFQWLGISRRAACPLRQAAADDSDNVATVGDGFVPEPRHGKSSVIDQRTPAHADYLHD